MELSFSTVNFSPMFGADVALDCVLDAATAAGFTAVALDVWSVKRYVERGGRPSYAVLNATLARMDADELAKR